MTKLKPNQFLLDGHIITEIPLLFQELMIQANLEDRKSMTRRTRGLDKINESPVCWKYEGALKENDNIHVFGRLNKEDRIVYREKINSPFGKPGDLLWVRERFTEWPKGSFQYKASTASGDELGIWKPSIHMPKTACRIWLMVEEIRVERLNQISPTDAVAEGCSPLPDNGIAQTEFIQLWMRINGRDSIYKNPWVWVVKFRVLSKTGRPSDEAILKHWKEVSNA